MLEQFTLTFTGWEAVWVVCAIIVAVFYTLKVLLTPLVSGENHTLQTKQ